MTRDLNGLSGKDRFFKILKDKIIEGTSSGKCRDYKYVCFSEAPISAIGRIIAASKKEIRYEPYGFMFSKAYLFKIGARPVLYQTDEEYELLPDELKYKHVSFDLNMQDQTDWMWEREWRLKAGELKLDYKSTTLILPNRTILEEIISQYQNNMHALSTRIGVFPQDPWHFIALEDLGFSFKDI